MAGIWLARSNLENVVAVPYSRIAFIIDDCAENTYTSSMLSYMNSTETRFYTKHSLNTRVILTSVLFVAGDTLTDQYIVLIPSMIRTNVEPLVNDLNKTDMHRFHSASV